MIPPTTRPVGPKCASRSTMPAARKVPAPYPRERTSGVGGCSCGCASSGCCASFISVSLLLPDRRLGIVLLWRDNRPPIRIALPLREATTEYPVLFLFLRFMVGVYREKRH